MTGYANNLVRAVAALVILCGSAHGHAQTPSAASDAPVPGLANITVNATRIADLTPDGVTITVDLALIPTRSFTVESIRFSGLRVNGLTLHADPVNHLLQLPKGKPTNLPPLSVKVFFRDLTTVAPLRQMLTDQAAQVQGQADVTLHATFVEKLALGTAHPIVMLPFTQKVPITLPDSPFGREAADTILNLVQLGLDSGAASASKAAFLEPDWIKTLKLQAPKAILQVESRYSLEQNRKSYQCPQDRRLHRCQGHPRARHPARHAQLPSSPRLPVPRPPGGGCRPPRLAQVCARRRPRRPPSAQLCPHPRTTGESRSHRARQSRIQRPCRFNPRRNR